MFTRLNTILLPDEADLNFFLDLASQVFTGQSELFHIDNTSYFAHLTLYSPEYPSSNINQVISQVHKLSSGLSPISLNFVDFHTSWGYLGLDFERSATIYKLHKSVLEALNPARDAHIREKYSQEISEGKYTPEEVENINNYGHHNVLSVFHPHLTLGRFISEELAIKAKFSLDKNSFLSQVKFSHLAIAETGPHGTCTKILHKFKLILPNSI